MQGKKKSGEYGETLAAEYLKEIGFKIVMRNYRFGKGEIDIIAREGDYLVFVEVKSRENLEFGSPEESITDNKKKQVRRIASGYLFENNITDQDCRFDFVGVFFNGQLPPEITHYRDAF